MEALNASRSAEVPDLAGEGIGGLTSLSLERVMFLGFENSFIFELLLLGSLSGGGPMDILDDGGKPGDGIGLRRFGNAALAAVAAASLLLPSVLLL